MCIRDSDDAGRHGRDDGSELRAERERDGEQRRQADDARVEHLRQRQHARVPVSYTHLSIEYETGSSTLRAHDATGGVDFNALRERYAGGDGCRIFLPDDTLASLLASFYRIDDRARIERMRLKALELVERGQQLSLIHISMCIRDRCSSARSSPP